MQTRISAYSFFSALLDGVQNQSNGKTSYDAATKYLVSYQDIPPYEELLQECTINVFKYDQYLRFFLEKENQNEVHLYNYHSLIQSVEEDISKIESNLTTLRIRFRIILIFMILILFAFVVTTSFLPMAQLYNNLLYLISTIVIFGFSLPLVFLLHYLFIKDLNYERK